MAKTSRWVGLLFALVLVAGCKKQEGGACIDRTDCGEGLACVGEGGVKRCEKCEGLVQCTANGQCTPQDGACVATSNGDCKKSYGCKQRGPCTAKDGACIVGGDADCAQSEACTKDKYCVAHGNNCVMSEADRKAAEKAKATELADLKEAQKKKDAAEAAAAKEE